MRRLIAVGAGVLAIVTLVSGCGSSSGSADADTSRPLTDSPFVKDSVVVKRGPGGLITFGAGNGFVPDDIPYGVYRTRQPSPGCAYKAESSRSELPLIENNIDVTTVVTIDRTVETFFSSKCGRWTNDLSPITEARTSFGDGTFIVGTDIAAGRYRAAGGPGCVYGRLPDFGDPSHAITGTSGRVVISSSDRGFVSIGCGRWRLG